MASESNTPRAVIVPPMSEFRFEVASEDLIELKVNGVFYAQLEIGTAEIFGSELVSSKTYTFIGPSKLAVFTQAGCTLSIKGSTFSEYISEEVTAQSSLGLHYALEGLRMDAAANDNPVEKKGPRVIVLGAGRSSLVKILLNYAVRQGHAPMWVDLDLLNGPLVFPGVLAASVLDGSTISPSEEIKTTPDILTFFYGLAGPCTGGDSIKTLFGTEVNRYLKPIINRLGANVCARMKDDPKVNISGMTVSGFPWVFSEGSSYICMELLECAIEFLQLDTIVVTGSERLYSELEKKFSPFLKILKMRASSGLVTKEPSFRRALLNKRITRYFRGGGLGVLPLETGPFLSFPVIVPFKDLHIRRIGEILPQAPISALPIGGSTRKLDENRGRITRIELLATAISFMGGSGSSLISTIHAPASSLLHSVLALSSAPVDQELAIIDAPVVGFVIVSDVDESRGRLTLSAPAPGRLPKSFLIWAPTSSLKCALLK